MQFLRKHVKAARFKSALNIGFIYKAQQFCWDDRQGTPLPPTSPFHAVPGVSLIRGMHGETKSLIAYHARGLTIDSLYECFETCRNLADIGANTVKGLHIGTDLANKSRDGSEGLAAEPTLLLYKPSYCIALQGWT